jgi:hypothetical protein
MTGFLSEKKEEKGFIQRCENYSRKDSYAIGEELFCNRKTYTRLYSNLLYSNLR